MFIVWGKKLVYRKLGYVADFCPICREAKPFELQRVGSAGHVYYITVGEGELVGYERTCQHCRISLQAEPSMYSDISKKPMPLRDLITHTFPNIQQVFQGRMELEDKVKKSPSLLTAEERHALIRQPFTLLASKVERRFSSTHIDKETAIAIAIGLGLMLAGPAIFSAIAPESQEAGLLTCISLGLLLICWKGMGSGKRFMQRDIIPVLANSLKPLNPSEGELNAVLAELKQLRNKMGKKLNVAALMDHLAQ